MNIAEVTDRFTVISGLSGKELYDWEFVCREACDYIESIKLPLADTEADQTCESRLVGAAAVYAFYRYTLLSHYGSEDFKAGDVQIKRSDTDVDAALKMWQNEVFMNRDILKGIGIGGFTFKRM